MVGPSFITWPSPFSNSSTAESSPHCQLQGQQGAGSEWEIFIVYLLFPTDWQITQTQMFLTKICDLGFSCCYPRKVKSVQWSLAVATPEHTDINCNLLGKKIIIFLVKNEIAITNHFNLRNQLLCLQKDCITVTSKLYRKVRCENLKCSLTDALADVERMFHCSNSLETYKQHQLWVLPRIPETTKYFVFPPQRRHLLLKTPKPG